MIMDNKERMLYLYRVILNNGNLQPLIDDTYTYQDVAMDIANMIRQKHAAYIDNRLVLTDLGKEEMSKLSRSLGRKPGEWIEPLVSEKIEKQSVEDIYLPPIKIFR